MITDRQREILNLIISLYAEEKMPIGSKALMDMIDASSATIRNDMKVLEDMGFIEKPHTSAGRVPSVDGYKFFVENFLQSDKLTQSEVFRVLKSFDGEFFRLTDIFKVASDTLSELTGLTSFVLNVPQKDQTLTHFNLAILDHHSVMAVMTLSTGEIRTNQFILPKSMTETELANFQKIVEERLLRKKIMEIHYILRTEIPQIIQQYFTATRDALKLFDQIFDDLLVEKLTSSGREKIFDYHQLASSSAYKLFDNDARMIHEIRALTETEDTRTVRFDSTDLLENLTVIAQKFVIPYRGIGVLSLVGPMALDYKKILTTLDLVAQALSLKLADYYRYLDGNHYEVR